MLTIDLDRPPRDRWTGLRSWREPALALLELYQRDLGSGATAAMAFITDVARQVLPADTMLELEGVAEALDQPLERVVLCNLYYDLIKSSVGCSAFAVDLPDGPVHGRNLDWWTTGGLLRDHTTTMTFLRAGRVHYRLVGWPGFIGCFTGVAPGRCSVSLNAVLSDDPAIVAEPVVFLLRRVLDSAPHFGAALEMLRDSPVASDALMLLVGTSPRQFAVIERTPRRSHVRLPEGTFITVTNDYRGLGSGEAGLGELARTSCSRMAHLETALTRQTVRSTSEAFSLLENAGVKMGITVQHVVMRASTGECEVRLPK
ncbi:MAG: acid ceramidase family protein [Myxococcaceae bacterium]|jgi:hypothetical protein|nr:acid ceramidase family protein [Myxococcaceae bacterium]